MRRSAARLAHSAAPLLALTSGLPVVVGSTATAGRGLFAITPLSAGQAVFCAQPVVCHPPLGDDGVCYSCLRTLGRGRALSHGRGFCCEACAASAGASWADLQHASPALARWQAACAARGELLPLLALRLACASASGAADAGVLTPLCYAAGAVEHPPDAWMADWADVAAAMHEAGVESSRVPSAAWWTAVLARLHINAFRVDIPRPVELATASRLADTGSGTAAYLLPSFLNHSCEPSLDVAWRGGDAEVTLLARHDVAAGDELTIAYVDTDAGLASRREALRYGYGFVCRCALCVEQEAEGAA